MQPGYIPLPLLVRLSVDFRTVFRFRRSFFGDSSVSIGGRVCLLGPSLGGPDSTPAASVKATADQARVTGIQKPAQLDRTEPVERDWPWQACSGDWSGTCADQGGHCQLDVLRAGWPSGNHFGQWLVRIRSRGTRSHTCFLPCERTLFGQETQVLVLKRLTSAPWRTRTSNHLIKSQMLCHLS